MNMDHSKIPQATAKRLPLYYRFLKNLHASGKQRVSSAEGNLGTAFLHYNFIKNNNTKIAMAFDINEEKIGTEVGDVPVYDLNKLEEHMTDDDIPVAILTVPAQAAQSITDRLVALGIKGILNFTPARLNVPEHIRIHHIDLAVELQSLVYFLKHYSMQEK
ncbi:Redox-sensing transcriptional repressor Rex [Bacillus licheniformis]|uniref:redox-sensing transcriptional repressor Rex n=1 Tax=Bacillus licheniformis TaxID=1402 RepID=UPI0011AB0EDF|nr:redox-sensing transcriptional repressor Rex [Bacillus licheniformis]TWN47832.1 Redox-sensing transcriptional repressor Rex [Bacillus licheniformis]